MHKNMAQICQPAMALLIVSKIIQCFSLSETVSHNKEDDKEQYWAYTHLQVYRKLTWNGAHTYLKIASNTRQI